MRPSRRLSNHLCSQSITTNALRSLWLLIIFWGELGVFFSSRFWCKWPRHEVPGSDALRVLLVTDTQIRTSESLSMFPLARSYAANQYLKKSWYIVKRLKPHAVFFLGDMLRDGKSSKTSAQYVELVKKFESVFVPDASTEMHYLPGNNDVGMGHVSSINLRAYYEKAFGLPNQVISLKNHTFLTLDAPGLVDEDYQRNARGISFDNWEPIPGGTVDAVRRVADQHYQPLILLSHIPLYRSDVASCGPLREKGTIHRGVGYGYQNTFGKQTTAFLLRALRPTMIFSGDNRDYCEYVHKGSSFGVEGLIPEITVKSFAPAPKIRRPGFQLLSVVDPSSATPPQPSLLHRQCLLPNQSLVFAAYVWSSIATLCILLTLNVQRIKNFRLRKQFQLFSPNQSNSSPLLQDSQNSSIPVWSPDALFMSPKSPRPQMPPPFRSPGASATPMFRASSRPMTPQNHETPMLSSQLIPTHDGEDLMFPDQYVIQRDIHHPSDEEWIPIGREDSLESSPHITAPDPRLHPAPSQFISAPGSLPTHRRQQSTRKPIWSKTFMWSGRRRRFVFAIPRLSSCWGACKDMVEILRDADQRTILRRRRGIIMSTLMESFTVIWPAGIFWLVVNFWMF